jgi:murein DD-endopeptidase MepM/ murein hydrolase activator NlpD
MKLAPWLKQTTKVSQLRFHHLGVFFLVAVLTCFSEGIEQQKLQALNIPKKQTTEVASSWKYASFPVENFQGLTSPFGYRVSPITGQKQFHNGLDMAAPIGSYVRNWWSGTIVELSDHTGCGTSIKIQSGNWQHIYCHLNGYVQTADNGRRYLIDTDGGIQLQEGQQIPVGARIARVGMTGNTTGPHLHWGLKYSGNYVDPYLVVQQMYKQKTAKNQVLK